METFDLLRERLLVGDIALKGSCVGKFNLISLDADFVKNLLPERLTLSNQEYTENGKHPLLLMFNDTYLQNANFPVPMNLHYNEFVIMVPFVKFKDDAYNKEAAYCFLPVLYLDNMKAVLGGRVFWSFNKEIADFDVTPTSFEVSRWRKLFSSSFVISNDSMIGTEYSNFIKWIPVLELPVIEDGLFKFMLCRYKIEYENIPIWPIESNTVNEHCKYLPQRTSISVPSIINNVMGGFMMKYKWSLTYLEHTSFT